MWIHPKSFMFIKLKYCGIMWINSRQRNVIVKTITTFQIYPTHSRMIAFSDLSNSFIPQWHQFHLQVGAASTRHRVVALAADVAISKQLYGIECPSSVNQHSSLDQDVYCQLNRYYFHTPTVAESGSVDSLRKSKCFHTTMLINGLVMNTNTKLDNAFGLAPDRR